MHLPWGKKAVYFVLLNMWKPLGYSCTQNSFFSSARKFCLFEPTLTCCYSQIRCSLLLTAPMFHHNVLLHVAVRPSRDDSGRHHRRVPRIAAPKQEVVHPLPVRGHVPARHSTSHTGTQFSPLQFC